MFQYDKNTVCKLLELPELDFYQSVPDSLKHFTPQFRGSIFYLSIHFHLFGFILSGIATVQYWEDESGYIKLVACPQTTCTENESDEQDITSTTDQQTSDNSLRKSVQFVSIIFFC
jgi:hypothetical protein